jgi:hypothetical protein
MVAMAVALASPALAQAAPDEATLAAARELMQVSDIQGQMRAMGPRMAQSMGVQMQQMFQDNAVPEGLNTQLTAAMQAYIGTIDELFTPQLVDQLATLYARHFTAAELQRVTVMMKDPVMLKFRSELPGLMAEMMPMMFEAMKPRQEQFRQKIMQIVADWMKQHPDDKAKLRSPISS